MVHSFEIFEQSASPCLFTTAQGEILYVNPALEELTQYSKDEMIGANPRLFQSGQTPVSVYHDLWKTILAGSPWRGELHNRKKTGECYWECITISPVIRQQTGELYYFATVDDRTEQKRKEGIRERQLDTLRSILRRCEKERMVSICAHCHSVRSQNDEWEDIAEFLDELLGCSCSHGICPRCLKKYYAEFHSEQKKDGTIKA